MASRRLTDPEWYVCHRCERCGDMYPDREGECSRCRLADRADRDALSARLVAEGLAKEVARP